MARFAAVGTLPQDEFNATGASSLGPLRIGDYETPRIIELPPRLRPRDIPDRQGTELFSFILKYIDEDEKDLFYQDLQEAVIEALASDSLEPIGRILADWEATEEIKADPELARELDEAIEESEAKRRGAEG